MATNLVEFLHFTNNIVTMVTRLDARLQYVEVRTPLTP